MSKPENYLQVQLKLSPKLIKNALLTGLAMILLQVGANYLYEPRSPFAKFILEGHLLFSILFLVLVGAFVLGLYFLFKAKFRKALVLLIWSGVFMPIIGFALYWDLTQLDVLNEDRVFYMSASNKEEKFILQYYETGLSGNPKWRAILVQDQYQSFRRFKGVAIDLLYPENGFDSSLGDRVIHLEKIPQTITFKGQKYLLEKSILFDSQRRTEISK
ncbi:hypothetical protein TH61_00930 [Rufibacter sp. DG15C]|uniref:hypothetical protein n=1 Tax=Rufibacter sp. DG15C TaxID=1379909 RepID=UPI00078DA0FF|nr:hypothetical protein [Rufibacter sp. DG15C]AMM50029.1 hypothetical protein TH61_00930 [Rufibacter sp. DG15C]